MHKSIAAVAILVSLSGCATSMICRPTEQDGIERCDPIVYVPPSVQQPVAYSVVPEHGPGYAPAYPPFDVPLSRMHRRDAWMTDTPHWQPGDE